MPYLIGGLFFIVVGLCMCRSGKLESDVDVCQAVDFYRRMLRTQRLTGWWFVGCGVSMAVAGVVFMVIA